MFGGLDMKGGMSGFSFMNNNSTDNANTTANNDASTGNVDNNTNTPNENNMESRNNEDSTHNIERNNNAGVGTTSSFSFLNSAADNATMTPEHAEVQAKPATETTTSAEASSSFSFLNSAIGGSHVNVNVNSTHPEQVVPEIKNVAPEMSAGGSLFDQLNMSMTTTATTATTEKKYIPSSSNATANLMSMSLPTSTLTPTAGNLSGASSTFTPTVIIAPSFQKAKPTAKSTVTRKKKRHVKIGVGAHQNSSDTLNSTSASSSAVAAASKSNYNSELPPSAPQSQSQPHASSHAVPENIHHSNKVYRSESASTLGDDFNAEDGNQNGGGEADEIVQRAQAAAQLAQKIDVATRSTPFFKNPFARNKKSSHGSNASTHSHGSDRSPAPSSSLYSSNNTNSNKPPVEEVKVVPNKYSLEDHPVNAADYGENHATNSYGVDKVGSVSATWSNRNNGGVKTPDAVSTTFTADPVAKDDDAPKPVIVADSALKVSDYGNHGTTEVTTARTTVPSESVPSYSNYKYQIPNYGSPTPISTKRLAPPEKLAAMKQNLTNELKYLIQSLHSNMQQMSQCKASLRILSGDEQLLSNKLDGLKAHMAHLVEAEEYELADVTSAQIDAIQINLDASKSELTSKMEDHANCVARYDEITLQIQEEYRSYAKSLDGLLSNDDGSNLEKLKEEKTRLDINLAELEVDADALKAERQELNDLILVESADFVAENVENENKLSSVQEEIDVLMTKLAEKQAAAKIFQDSIRGNNVKIDAQRDKHKFKFKKLTNLQKSLESTRSEYATIVGAISEKLEAAVNFQSNLGKESSSASDAMSILPKLFEKIDDDSSEEMEQARAEVISAKGSLAEVELELNNAKSTQEEISVKLNEIRESIPQLQTQKGQAAQARNFKLAAGINKKLKDLQKEEDALGDGLLANEDKIDKLSVRVDNLKQTVIAQEEISNRIEADFVRIKLTKIKDKIKFCENSVSDDGVLAPLLEADLNHWKSVGENLCSEYGLVWSELNGATDVIVGDADADKPSEESQQVEEELSPHYVEIKALTAVERLELYNSLSAKIVEKETALELAIEVEDFDEAAELDELILELKVKFEVCGGLLGEDDDTTEEDPAEQQQVEEVDVADMVDQVQEDETLEEPTEEAASGDEDCVAEATITSSAEVDAITKEQEDKNDETEQQTTPAESQHIDEESGEEEASSKSVADDEQPQEPNNGDGVAPSTLAIDATDDDRQEVGKDPGRQ